MVMRVYEGLSKMFFRKKRCGGADIPVFLAFHTTSTGERHGMP